MGNPTTRMERMLEKADARHQRFEVYQQTSDAQDIRGGIICSMLSSEATEAHYTAQARAVVRYQRKFLEETTNVKAYIILKKRLRTKFRAMGWAIVVVFHLVNAATRQKGRAFKEVVASTKPQPRPMSPRSKASEFMERVQKGPISDESPAVNILKAKQLQDLKTAENRMFKTGELTRLKELRAKTKLDDVETEVLGCLEAKMQGMIVAAELERKDKEHLQRKKMRQERIKENEKAFLQSKMVATIQREEKLRQLKAPVRQGIKAIARLVGRSARPPRKPASTNKYDAQQNKVKASSSSSSSSSKRQKKKRRGTNVDHTTFFSQQRVQPDGEPAGSQMLDAPSSRVAPREHFRIDVSVIKVPSRLRKMIELTRNSKEDRDEETKQRSPGARRRVRTTPFGRPALRLTSFRSSITGTLAAFQWTNKKKARADVDVADKKTFTASSDQNYLLSPRDEMTSELPRGGGRHQH